MDIADSEPHSRTGDTGTLTNLPDRLIHGTARLYQFQKNIDKKLLTSGA
jgi:hypothetical protein